MIKRLDYVDIFRGIALLIMVTIQIFDFLSVSSIYTTPPYYVEMIHSVTWFPPSLLFTFVSGMSVFLLLRKRMSGSQPRSKLKVLKEIFKRYGKYILISLPFTIIMWNIFIYLRWEEAIQGIGLTAIFTAGFILMFYKILKKMRLSSYLFLFSIIILFAFLQSQMYYIVDSTIVGEIGPRQPDLSSPFSVIWSVILNSLFRGWFSIFNLFPIMLGGVILINLIMQGIDSKKLVFYSALYFILTFVIHFLGLPINYYGRSFMLTHYAVSQSALICSIAFWFYNNFTDRITSSILNFLKQIGYAAFFLYVSHYLLILKVLEISGYKDLLPDLHAWILTIPLVGIMYILSKWYLKIRSKLPKVLQL
ncbi:hypothetical protein HN836_00175 [Candidatus Woesearchaeota archaeon]|nr:hypothetical protein [Candidatus Woesearchaeota archaeon]